MAAKAKTVQPVLLQRHHAGDEVVKRDLDQIQDNVDRLLRQVQATPLLTQQIGSGQVQSSNIANGAINANHLGSGAVATAAIAPHSIGDLQVVVNGLTNASIAPNTLSDGQIAPKGITNASIADGTIQALQIANGAVTQAKLESFLRLGCKYLVAADQTLASGAAITFASKVFDGFAQVTGSNYQPPLSGVFNITARVRLTGGAIIPGTSVRLVLMTGTTRVLQGPECPVFHDQSNVDVAIATLDEGATLQVGNYYFFMFEVATATPGIGSGPLFGSATVKAASQADYTISSNGTHVYVPFAASYFQALPVAQ